MVTGPLKGEAGRLSELAGDEVGDGDQVPGGAMAVGLGGLDLCIRRLDTAVGELGIEGVEDAVPMGFGGLGEILHRCEAAAPGPAVPACEQRLGVLAGVDQAEDLAQAFLDPVDTAGLEIEAAQIDVLPKLMAAPALLVLEPQVATCTGWCSTAQCGQMKRAPRAKPTVKSP